MGDSREGLREEKSKKKDIKIAQFRKEAIE
jgi:hypothetical protein